MEEQNRTTQQDELEDHKIFYELLMGVSLRMDHINQRIDDLVKLLVDTGKLKTRNG